MTRSGPFPVLRAMEGSAIVRSMVKLLKGLWMRFAAILAAVNSAIVLTVVFFFVVTPIGLLMRLFGRSAYSASAQAPPQWHPLPPDSDPRKPF
jgi:uncharacterized membrane protein YcfT